MTTTCDMRAIITGPLPPPHHALSDNHDDKHQHTCDVQLDPETNDHIGLHTCHICSRSFRSTDRPFTTTRTDTRPLTNPNTGGEGQTRNPDSLETPRTVAISLSATTGSYYTADEGSGWVGRRIVVVKPGDTLESLGMPTGDYVALRQADGVTMYGETRAATAARLMDASQVTALGFDTIVFGRQMWFAPHGTKVPYPMNRETAAAMPEPWRLVREMGEIPAPEHIHWAGPPTPAERAAETADGLRALHDRTAAMFDSVISGLKARGRLPGSAVQELAVVRENLNRLRPVSDVDVAQSLDVTMTAVINLARVVSSLSDTVKARDPKPASYMVDGLEPHNFRNDGTYSDQNSCTWRGVADEAFPDGRLCGYGANAMIHRRMVRMGKNAAPAPAAGPSTQDYLVWSNQKRMWWGPNRAGYTHLRAEAGRYTRDEAEAIVRDSSAGYHLRHTDPANGVVYADEVVWAV